MPLFDFECPEHGVFDAFQKANREGLRTEPCPKCGKMAAMKWSNGASHKFTFKDGFDACTGEYHPTKRHYEETCRRKGLVKVE